ncbi:ribosome-associated translation inhibitor RaiA [Cyclobacteriaceae bacterium]|nr:ribosome-associated translation inhibitor RaiA [Cyclobacteriaceae bacterium]
MKLQMSSLKFDADQKLLDFVQKKADKLDTYYDKIIDGEVSMKLEKSEDNSNKIVEMKLNIPGTSLFAKEQAASFEAAADDAVEALRRQLRKHKGKQFEKR